MKLEKIKEIQSEQEKGRELLEMGELRIRELEEYFSYNEIEILDDEDESVIVADCNESADISNDISDESPFYLQSPGFDDCLSKEETEYIRKKHSTIVLADNIQIDKNDVQQVDSARDTSSLASTFAEVEAEFQNSTDVTEQLESEMQLEIEQLLSSLENIF